MMMMMMMSDSFRHYFFFRLWCEEMRQISPLVEIATYKSSQTLPQQPKHMMNTEFQGGHANLDPRLPRF